VQLTVTDAAKKFGVNPATIRDMCRGGRVPAIKVPHIKNLECGMWMVDTDALEVYWKKQAGKFQCKPLLETTKAYIAGLLDGEGCFTAFITRQQSHHIKNGHRTIEAIHWQTIYYIQILIVEEEPIHWLKEITGLGYVFKRNRQKQGWQDLWGWRVASGPACEIVKQIMPYLKIKRRHAEIFLALRDRVASIKDYRTGKANDAPLPKEEYIERQKLIDEIHRLNKSTGKVLRKEYSVKAT